MTGARAWHNSVETGRYGGGTEGAPIEDPAALRGEGRFTDDLVRGADHLVFCARPTRMRASSATTPAPPKAVPGVRRYSAAPSCLQAGVKPIGPAVPFPRPDGTPSTSAPRHVSRARPRALRRTRRWRRWWPRVARGRWTVPGDRRRLRELPAVTDPFAAMRAGAPLLSRRGARRHRRRDAPRRRRGHHAAFAQAAHRVSLATRQPAPRAGVDRVVAGRPDGRPRHHARQPDATAVLDGVAGYFGLKERARDGGRRGRRLRHESRALPEDVVVAHAAHYASGDEVVRPAPGGASVHFDLIDAGGARGDPAMGSSRRWCGDPFIGPWDHQHLRHPDDRAAAHGGDDQHHAHWRLPRRGPAGETSTSSAPDGRGGAS